jgi:hypothetical protein
MRRGGVCDVQLQGSKKTHDGNWRGQHLVTSELSSRGAQISAEPCSPLSTSVALHPKSPSTLSPIATSLTLRPRPFSLHRLSHPTPSLSLHHIQRPQVFVSTATLLQLFPPLQNCAQSPDSTASLLFRRRPRAHSTDRKTGTYRAYCMKAPIRRCLALLCPL